MQNFDGKLESCPMWAFDGSSTRQAEGGSSDCLLKPVAIYPDPVRRNGFLVMNEVLIPMEVLMSQMEEQLLTTTTTIFGLVLSRNILWNPETNLPLGFPKDQTPLVNSIVQLVAKIPLEEK